MRSDIDLSISCQCGAASWSISITRDVWILGEWNLVVGFKVLKNIWLISTIASLVSIVLTAGDNLLLRKVRKVISVDEDGGFNDGSGAKCVARSALTLVLYRIDGTFGSPIY